MAKFLILIFIFLLTSCSTSKTTHNKLKTVDCYEVKQLEMSKNVNAQMELNNKFKIFNNLANCLSENKKFNESLYYYEIALTAPKITPVEQSILYSNMANNYILTNNLDLASSTLEKSLYIYPNNNNALTQLGIINFYNNNYKKSFEYLTKIKNPSIEVRNYITANLFFLNQTSELNNNILKKSDINTDEYKLLEGAFQFTQKKLTRERLVEIRKLKINSNPFKIIQLYIDKNYGNNKI